MTLPYDHDPLAGERVAEGVVVPRANDGSPMIVPRGELIPVRYDRASSVADYLAKDIFGIKKWEMRLLAEGLGRRPDLAALAGVETYNTGLGLVQPMNTPEENKASGKRLDEIIERALDSVGIHEKADAGTVAHAATEPGFSGAVPDILKSTVEAIHELTAALTVVATEVFVANDVTCSAGTFDHAYYLEDQQLAHELSDYFTEKLGFTVDLCGALIGDKKTGKNMHPGEFEIQLGGTYANGEVYLGPPKLIEGLGRDLDRHEDQRLTLEEYFGGPVNRTTGLLVHASTTGSPKPRVLPIDLERGYRLAKTAVLVRNARNELDKIGIPKKLDTDLMARRVLERELELASQDFETLGADAFRARTSELWRRFRHVWTDKMTEQVKERLVEL